MNHFSPFFSIIFSSDKIKNLQRWSCFFSRHEVGVERSVFHPKRYCWRKRTFLSGKNVSYKNSHTFSTFHSCSLILLTLEWFHGWLKQMKKRLEVGPSMCTKSHTTIAQVLKIIMATTLLNSLFKVSFHQAYKMNKVTFKDLFTHPNILQCLAAIQLQPIH